MQSAMVSNNDKDKYPAVVDPDECDDEGYVKPYFDLHTVRELAANTQAAAEEFGHGSIDTVHVVDGDAQGDPPALVVVVTWMDIESKGVAEATTIVEPIRHREDDSQDNDPEDAGEWLWPVGGIAWRWYAFGPDGIHPQIPYQPEQ
ncbi:hypothetical protein [Streptomyces boncukensis]|uniref:Uncharacterized protein n=1 Tax=Streptomyces boncukensis TaxID=2711219 RepID=A0A6G4WQ71_9ACTN|nr:hypothetical protein [Streptomyces boncukensis]NGO66777.1 hypothetical protein [Streptomyces boncukensis]